MSNGLRWSEQMMEAYNAGKRAAAVPEREHQRAILDFLQLHPAVAWALRMNTGAMTIDDRFIKFGAKGFPDIIGQMKDGRLLAFECKRVGGKLTEDQSAFIAAVQRNNGVASWGQLEHAMHMLDVAIAQVTHKSTGS